MSKIDMKSVMGLIVGIFILAYVGLPGFNAVFNQPDYTQTTNGSAFTTTAYPQTFLLHPNIVAGSYYVYNTSYSNLLLVEAGNYSIDLASGQLTTASNMSNATSYTVTYQSGAKNAGVTTIATTVVGVVVALSIIIVILRLTGIRIFGN